MLDQYGCGTLNSISNFIFFYCLPIQPKTHFSSSPKILFAFFSLLLTFIGYIIHLSLTLFFCAFVKKLKFCILLQIDVMRFIFVHFLFLLQHFSLFHSFDMQMSFHVMCSGSVDVIFVVSFVRSVFFLILLLNLHIIDINSLFFRTFCACTTASTRIN